MSEKNNAFSKRTRLLMNGDAFNLFFYFYSLIYKSSNQGYLFSEPIYYMLRLSKHFAHRIRATREHFKITRHILAQLFYSVMNVSYTCRCQSLHFVHAL